MATEIGKDTKVKLSLETIISLGIVLVTMTGMWFTLQADIAEAKELPLAPDPEVTRMEFDMKDQMIRNTIMTTQEDVKELKETVRRIEDKLDRRWKKYAIAIVPTIIVLDDGEEVKRFQADLSFKLVATREEIQEYIDELIISKF